MNIVPAILPQSFDELTEKLFRIEGISKRVQIDLSDGVFGRVKTWMPQGTETLPNGFSYEFDIILNDWKLPTMHAITIGATSIVSHVDMFTDEDLDTLISIVAPTGVSLGISVSNDKSLDFHAEMIRKARAAYGKVFIQVMGIANIGEQGLPFDDRVPARVMALRQQFGDMSIQVDGGIKPENALLVANAGTTTAIVGSFIFGSDDVAGAIEKMQIASSN